MSYAPPAAIVKRIEEAIAPFPDRSAALLSVLHIIQDDAGFIPAEAEVWVAAKLGVRPIRVREVVSFYSMFRRSPAGGTIIQVCRNLSCHLAGAEDILAYFRDTLGVGPGGTTPDGRYTLVTVECLGNCDHAPCLQVDGVDYGPVTRELAAGLLKELKGHD